MGEAKLGLTSGEECNQVGKKRETCGEFGRQDLYVRNFPNVGYFMDIAQLTQSTTFNGRDLKQRCFRKET